MDKKGIEWSLVELGKLILAFVVIVGVFVPLGMSIYHYFVPTPDKQTMDNLASLASEVNQLQPDKNIKIPLYIGEGFIIVSYNEVKDIPKQCRQQACLCLYPYSKDDEKAPETPSKCEVTKGIVYSKNGEMVSEGSKTVFTVDITNQGGIVEINKIPVS